MIRYLKRIENTWDTITLPSRHIWRFVDIQTVEALQRRVLGISRANRDFTIYAMRKGSLFPKIKDESIRQRVEEPLLSIRCLIPSIKSMHENLKNVEIGSKLLKKFVIGRISRGTLQSTLRSDWRESRDIVIESASGVHKTLNNVPVKESWDFTYKQLWILCLETLQI